MTSFYVEGCTADGESYGPVHLLTTPLERDIFEELVEGFDALREIQEEAEQAREDAWREAVARSRGKDSPE